MLLVKKQGGCSIGQYTWEHDGDAVEAPDDLAHDLLAIPGGDFSRAEDAEPAGDAAPADAPAPAEQPATPAAPAPVVAPAPGEASASA